MKKPFVILKEKRQSVWIASVMILCFFVILRSSCRLRILFLLFRSWSRKQCLGADIHTAAVIDFRNLDTNGIPDV